MTNPYDIVLTGGRLLDPASSLDTVADIAITGRTIAAIAPDIDASATPRVVNLTGKIITPGLIDLHTHVAGGIGRVASDMTFANADTAGVHSGVTTVVDCGSTGAYNVAGLVNHVVHRAKTRVIVFINAGILGIHKIPEIRDESDIDIDASIAQIKASEHIRGVKVRMVSPSVRQMGVELPRKAKQIAAGGGVQMMVHVGDIAEDSPEAGEAATGLLNAVLTAGDIVTHTCSFHVGALLDNGKLRPEAIAARERGVWFDVGVGRANFSFESAKAVMDQGLIPDTISSDVTAAGRLQIVHGLIESMNKFLALGLSLENVITMATANPAKVLGLSDTLGALQVGREADLSVLETITGSWVFRDPTGGSATSETALIPNFSIRSGEIQPLDFGPHPWGWRPESTD